MGFTFLLKRKEKKILGNFFSDEVEANFPRTPITTKNVKNGDVDVIQRRSIVGPYSHETFLHTILR